MSVGWQWVGSGHVYVGLSQFGQSFDSIPKPNTEYWETLVLEFVDFGFYIIYYSFSPSNPVSR